MKMQIFYTSDDSSIVSKAIQWAINGRYHHCGILFTLDVNEYLKMIDWCDAKNVIADSNIVPINGIYRVYFESIWKVDELSSKTGVRGPYDITNLTDWQKEKCSSRVLVLRDLPFLCQQEIQDALLKLIEAVPVITYAKLQIWHNFKALLRGIGLPADKRTTTEWTCSETCARVLPCWFKVDVLRIGDWLYDEVAPCGDRKRLLPLMEKIHAYKWKEIQK